MEQGLCNHNGSEDVGEGNTLLQIQRLEVTNTAKRPMRKKLNSLWDPGSTLSFITFKAAEELGLRGDPIELEIFTVGGGKKSINSRKFKVAIADQKNEVEGMKFT